MANEFVPITFKGDASDAVKAAREVKAALKGVEQGAQGAGAALDKATSHQVAAAARQRSANEALLRSFRERAATAEKGSREEIAATRLAEQAQRKLAGAYDHTADESRRAARAHDDHGIAIGKLGRGTVAGTGIFGGFARSIAFASGAFLGAAGLTATVRSFFDEMSQSALVTAQTNAAIKSTGGVAGVSAKQIDSLAQSLLRKSGADDEAIKSSANLLLTFTNVRNVAGQGNDIFNQATRAALDMSFALGTDLSGASIQLGKALQDPIKGMTALRRVGVALTDAQTEQVKALVQTGDVMGAQKLILAELTKEFGGSAQAAGRTLPGSLNILRETFKNLGASLLTDFTPQLRGAADWLQRYVDHLQNSESFHRQFRDAVQKVGEVVRTTTDVVRDIVGVIRTISPVLKGAVDALGGFKSVIELVLGVILLKKVAGGVSALTGLARAFRLLGPAAVEGSAVATGATGVAGVGTAAEGATAKVGRLRGALRGLKALGPIGIVIGIEQVLKHKGEIDKVGNVIDKYIAGDLKRLGIPTGPFGSAGGGFFGSKRPAGAQVPAPGALLTPPGGGLGVSLGPGAAYPVSTRGKLIGVPGQGTHSFTSGPQNWQSDNAIDIAVKVGTPVVAVESGTIGDRIGALEGSPGGQFAGLRLTLLGDDGNEYYYAHLVKIIVKAGQTVAKGQILGLSGSANGVAHLHIASKQGNPQSILASAPLVGQTPPAPSRAVGQTPPAPSRAVALQGAITAARLSPGLADNLAALRAYAKHLDERYNLAKDIRKKTEIGNELLGVRAEIRSTSTQRQQASVKGGSKTEAVGLILSGKLDGEQTRNAQLIYAIAKREGASDEEALEIVAAAYAESKLRSGATNKASGAAGLFQLLSSGYVTAANARGGVRNPRANAEAIVPDYIKYFRSHPFAKPGEAGRDVERSGEGADFYAPDRRLFRLGRGGFAEPPHAIGEPVELAAVRRRVRRKPPERHDIPPDVPAYGAPRYGIGFDREDIQGAQTRYQARLDAAKKAAKDAADQRKQAAKEAADLRKQTLTDIADFNTGVSDLRKQARIAGGLEEAEVFKPADLGKLRSSASAIKRTLLAGVDGKTEGELRDRLSSIGDKLKAGVQGLVDNVTSKRGALADAWQSFFGAADSAFDQASSKRIAAIRQRGARLTPTEQARENARRAALSPEDLAAEDERKSQDAATEAEVQGQEERDRIARRQFNKELAQIRDDIASKKITLAAGQEQINAALAKAGIDVSAADDLSESLGDALALVSGAVNDLSSAINSLAAAVGGAKSAAGGAPSGSENSDAFSRALVSRGISPNVALPTVAATAVLGTSTAQERGPGGDIYNSTNAPVVTFNISSNDPRAVADEVRNIFVNDIRLNGRDSAGYFGGRGGV